MALSEVALRFAQDIRYRGQLAEATHYGVAGSPGDGPFFQLWLKVEGGRIERASYQTHGCPSSMAAGGALCTLITGREFEKAMMLTKYDLIAFLGELPEGKEYCLDQAAKALTVVTENSNE